MQHQKLVSDGNIIEFHNNWLGEETITVNGEVVSKKSSIWGTNHYFTILESGETTRYILTSRLNEMMQVVIDLTKNGELVQENVVVSYGLRPQKPVNQPKAEGLKKLKEYDLEAALEDFDRALTVDFKDAEIHFYMACAYSVMERTEEGFEALKKARGNGLLNHERILTHDMLAFLRMHPAFEGFRNSGFTKYDSHLVKLKYDEMV